MNQFLINVLAWLLMHSGISIPEIPALEENGFNQPVPCQFDFRSETSRPCDVPAVNRREQLRGVLFVFELPAASTNSPVGKSILEDPISTEPLVRIVPVVSCIAESVHEALLSISEFVQATSTSVNEWTFMSVVKLVHPQDCQSAPVSKVKLQNAFSRFGKFGLNKVVERARSAAKQLSLYFCDSPDSYWTYYQDCDRWGVVLKSMDVPSSPEIGIVKTDEVFRSVSNQVQLTLRVLVPGFVEFDLIQSSGETMFDVSRSAIRWWKMVVIEVVKPSISRALQLPISWR